MFAFVVETGLLMSYIYILFGFLRQLFNNDCHKFNKVVNYYSHKKKTKIFYKELLQKVCPEGGRKLIRYC